MALITRLSRLFHADINAVLDKIEEPELLLKQAIREMEETLCQHKKQIKLVELDHQNLLSQEVNLKQSLVDFEAQLKICFESDKDELAQSVVKRKLETTYCIKTLSEKISNAEKNAQQLKSQFKEHQDQLNNLKQKADLIAQTRATHHNNSLCNVQKFSIQDEEVKIAFLQEKQKWSQS